MKPRTKKMQQGQPITNWVGMSGPEFTNRAIDYVSRQDLAKLSKQVAAVAAVVNSEKKWFDGSINGAMPTAAAVTGAYLLGITEGTDEQNRDGRSIRIKSLEFRWTLTPGVAAATQQHCRFIVVRDNAPDGAVPALTDVLSGALMTAFPNLLTKTGRFKIINDQVFSIPPTGSCTDGFDRTTFMKLDYHTEFNGTGATIASAGMGAMYLYLFADAIVGNASTMYVSWRVRYYDN